LTEQVVAACLLAGAQALRLRLKKNEIEPDRMVGLQELLNQIEAEIPFLEADRPLERDLRRTLELIASRHWRLDDGSETAKR
jgi:histidine ammonia-lyase